MFFNENFHHFEEYNADVSISHSAPHPISPSVSISDTPPPQKSVVLYGWPLSASRQVWRTIKIFQVLFDLNATKSDIDFELSIQIFDGFVYSLPKLN